MGCKWPVSFCGRFESIKYELICLFRNQIAADLLYVLDLGRADAVLSDYNAIGSGCGPFG